TNSSMVWPWMARTQLNVSPLRVKLRGSKSSMVLEAPKSLVRTLPFALAFVTSVSPSGFRWVAGRSSLVLTLPARSRQCSVVVSEFSGPGPVTGLHLVQKLAHNCTRLAQSQLGSAHEPRTE